MRRVNVKFLRPGQLVADTITNKTGAVLCPLGYTLTERSIERLGNAGITAIWIEGDPDAGPDIDTLETNLNKRFNGIEDPVLLRVKALRQKRFDQLRAEYSGE